MPEEEQSEFRAHFNSVVEGEDDLGGILIGSWEDFQSRMKFLDDDATEEYTQELLAQEVLDAEYLEQSLRDATAKAN